MSPELIIAIKQRIAAGQNKETIKTEVLAMGHVEEVFEAAYTLAVHDLEKPVSSEVVGPVVVLPSAYNLLGQALTFVSKRLDLMLCTLLPGLVAVVLSYVSQKVAEPAGLSIALDVLAVVAFVVYLVSMFLVMYMASQESTPTYSQGLQWVREHILSLLWVSILFAFVVLGGFMLLAIPGFILMVSLYFSQYALILEDQKGMSALARSRELVKGRFFAIALKLFAFTLYIVFPIIIVVALVTMATTGNPALASSTLVGDLVTEFFSALFAVVSAYAIGQLYRALQIGRPLTVVTTARKWIYWTLFTLGIVVVGIIVVLVLFFQSFLPDTVMGETTALRSEIQSMTLTASLYALEHDGSFAGVCDTLRTRITIADTVECNESETQWAIQGELNGERWCADTTTMGKVVQTPLDSRLTCLALPDRQLQETPAESGTSTDMTVETAS